jgi:adenosyl cobinamide kinase/adenosyl cobinamide phosphate guanylyltransferase
MKLIIGGAFQGKLSYALDITGIDKSQAVDGAVCAEEDIYHAPLIYHFHEYVKRLVKEDKPFMDLAKDLMERNPDVVLVSNELGYGVVPIDAFDRKYREGTGRLCCLLAKEATEVHRVVCGLGQVIKGA